MKKSFLSIFLFAATLMSVAQENKQPVELRAFGMYGYNYTWGHYGGVDLSACVPINQHFELSAAVEASSANLYTIVADARPLFPLSVGALYLDTRVQYKAVVRNRMHEALGAFALGYRMDYVDVELGMYSRLMSEFGRDWHSEDEILVEPLGFLYSIEVFVRPQTSRWNLSLRFSDCDDYQVERLWQPLFMLGGKFSPTEKLSVLAQVQIKPTGMFHLDASFYGATARVGVSYKL